MIYRQVAPAELTAGDMVRYLGRHYTVRNVKRSLGSGWEVIFKDGPSANFVLSASVVDADATRQAFGLAGEGAPLVSDDGRVTF